ncbi:PAS domain S-box protein [Ancylothrix sp. C2]|uniref:PAS domain S-box protein n=1 Tax=Ancylothrix sp. D3o TaxID=2953691 RepID=UPI0021BA433C|nr:PAS domain S-box protein [Ancylothrix sp. D3o]MCT7948891.1 PAS domain S-box protein [Ancylothrix sp. D3o]
MKIQNKLILSFGSFAIFAIVSSNINILNNFKFSEKLARVSSSNLPKIAALEELKATSVQLSVEAYRYALIKLESEKFSGTQGSAFDIQKIERYNKSLQSSLKILQKLADSPEDIKKFEQIELSRRNYLLLLQQVVNLKPSQKKGLNLDFKKEQLQISEARLLEGIEQALGEEIAALTQQQKALQNHAHQAIAINSISVIILIAMCGGVALFLSKRIVNPLLGIQQSAANLDQTNQVLRINLEHQNDEIAMLADAFKQMAENLSQKALSQFYVDNILRSMIDALIILHPDKTIKTFNLATFLMLGCEKEDDLLGKPVQILFGDDQFLQDLEDDEFTQNNSFLGRKETSLLAKNNRHIPVYFSASVIRDQRGNIEGFVCLAQDISDRKRAETAMQESEAKWRSLVENAPDIILTADREGTIQFINRPVPELPSKPVIGSSIYDWVKVEERQHLQQSIEIVFATGEPQYNEIAGFSFDGTPAWYANRIGPIFKNGEVAAITIITTDISERKRIEQALRESEESLEGILNSLTDVVWSIDAKNRQILYLNPATERVYGRPVSDFFNNSKLWVEIIHPEDQEKFKQISQAVLATGSQEIQYRIIRPNGEIRWLQDRGKLIQASDGTPLRIDGIARDITERKNAEQALQKANEELELRVQERTKAIKQTNKRLQKEIAERQVVTEALRQSEERLNSILNSLDDVVWSIDTGNFATLYISPAAEKIYGCAISDFFNKPDLWSTIVHPQDRENVEKATQKLFKNGFVEFEYRILRSDSEVRWLRSQSRLVYDANGKPIRMDGIASDITARKAAEALVRSSEARFKHLAKREALLNKLAGQIRNSLELDTILDTAVREIRNLLQVDRCLFIWYRQYSAGVQTYEPINPISVMSGTPAPFVAGSPYWEVAQEARNPILPSYIGHYAVDPENVYITKLLNLEIIRVDDFSKISEPILQLLGSMWGYNSLIILPIQTKSGEIGLLSCGHHTAVRPWRDTELALLRSISDQLSIAISQAELYNHATEAARAAKEQAQQLQEAMKALQQTQAQLIQTEKMSSLGQMVAGIAHEINNPVSFIYGNVDPAMQYIQDLLNLLKLYREEYSPTQSIAEEIEAIDLEFLEQDLPKLLASMKLGADRIRQIVLSLRNFSRLDEAQMKAVNLHEGIDSTLLILQNRLKAKGDKPEIKVIKEYGDLPPVECFVGQLNQVFMNIIANAIDALEMRPPQKQMDTKSASSRPIIPIITISTTLLEDQQVKISISDNGSGMRKEVMARIFDPFFTTKPVGSGTGLGLSISYQIVVDKHKGNLKCLSTLGEGTEFIIELPVIQNYAEPALFK